MNVALAAPPRRAPDTPQTPPLAPSTTDRARRVRSMARKKSKRPTKNPNDASAAAVDADDRSTATAREDEARERNASAASSSTDESTRERSSSRTFDVDVPESNGETRPTSVERPIELRVTVRPEFILSSEEGTLRIAVLEEVVDDLKLELDGYRAAARELAIEIERKDRALERAERDALYERSEGRALAVHEATNQLATRLEKAERAVERERTDGERGRKALDRLRALELELERRMLDQDDAFELKWRQRVEEANANAEAFRGKLARLEREMQESKEAEEEARAELASANRRVDELSALLSAAPSLATDGETEPTKPRRGGLFSFITGVPTEAYAGPKRATFA